jgi:phosphomannomutase
VLEWFSEVSSQIAGDFLERWPTLQKLQKARPDTLRTFLIQHHSCRSEHIQRRLEEIRRAVPATDDTAVIASSVAAVIAVVRLLRELRQAIHSYDEQIETMARQHPDFVIFDSLPGAGAALVPRLIAALGNTARPLQQRQRTAVL